MSRPRFAYGPTSAAEAELISAPSATIAAAQRKRWNVIAPFIRVRILLRIPETGHLPPSSSNLLSIPGTGRVPPSSPNFTEDSRNGTRSTKNYRARILLSTSETGHVPQKLSSSPRKRGPSGVRQETLGSRFRGNDDLRYCRLSRFRTAPQIENPLQEVAAAMKTGADPAPAETRNPRRRTSYATGSTSLASSKSSLILSSLPMSMVTLPPLVSRPKSSSSASALRMVS